MSTKKILLWVTFYAIAMGLLESAVVIYLRVVMYPDGFTFPLVPLHHNLATVELWREVATIIMLAAIGIMAGKNKGERLAYFLYSFAIWDIFYYVFLYIFLGWPQSLMTWDILFLIPVPWVGPVITPVIIALTMIAFALSAIRFSAMQKDVSLKWRERALLMLGALVAIASFTEDYIRQNKSILYSNLHEGTSFLSEMANYAPVHFDWYTFWAGELILLACYVMYCRRVLTPAPSPRVERGDMPSNTKN